MIYSFQTLKTSLSRRIELELAFFLIVFTKNSVRFDPNMMHTGGDDKFCLVDRFGSIEPNFLHKKNKN